MASTSLFSQIARQAAKANPYKKAAKYGMVDGSITKQAAGVRDRRNARIRKLQSDIDDKQDKIFRNSNYEYDMNDQYDDYIEEQLEMLRAQLEDNRPSSFVDEAWGNGFEDHIEIPADNYEPDTFVGNALFRSLPEYDQGRIDHLEDLRNSSDDRWFRPEHIPNLGKRTPNFQNWNKAMRIQKENQDFGHKLAKLKALGDAGKVVPMNGNPVIGGEGKAFTLDQIIAGLKNQGYSDTEIKDYILRTKVQH